MNPSDGELKILHTPCCGWCLSHGNAAMMRYISDQVVVSNMFGISPRKLGKISNLTNKYFSNGLVEPPTR